MNCLQGSRMNFVYNYFSIKILSATVFQEHFFLNSCVTPVMLVYDLKKVSLKKLDSKLLKITFSIDH